MIKECKSQEDYEHLLEASKDNPVVLFKHSTMCPISRKANSEFDRFASDAVDVECWKVMVIEDRPVSAHIAEETGIRHESPQAILFVKGKPVWNTSHWQITRENLAKACEECKK